METTTSAIVGDPDALGDLYSAECGPNRSKPCATGPSNTFPT